jgi:hypothetical protein
MSFISNIFDWLRRKVDPLPRPKIYALIYYRLPVYEKEKILKQYRHLLIQGGVTKKIDGELMRLESSVAIESISIDRQQLCRIINIPVQNSIFLSSVNTKIPQCKIVSLPSYFDLKVDHVKILDEIKIHKVLMELKNSLSSLPNNCFSLYQNLTIEFFDKFFFKVNMRNAIFKNGIPGNMNKEHYLYPLLFGLECGIGLSFEKIYGGMIYLFSSEKTPRNKIEFLLILFTNQRTNRKLYSLSDFEPCPNRGKVISKNEVNESNSTCKKCGIKVESFNVYESIAVMNNPYSHENKGFTYQEVEADKSMQMKIKTRKDVKYVYGVLWKNKYLKIDNQGLTELSTYDNYLLWDGERLNIDNWGPGLDS